MRSIGHLFAALTLAVSLAACGGTSGKNPPIATDDMQLGNPAATIQVVEYASAACSHCAEFDDVVFPGFKAKYIDTGQIHYALRELITSPEAYAEAGFLLARCAGKDRYFGVLAAVFRAQEQWEDQLQKNQTPDFRTPLLQVALAAGMTEPQFNTCIQDDKAIEALNTRVKANIKNTLNKEGRPQGTPIFYINGVQAFNGVPTLPDLDKAIAAAKTAK